LETINDAGAKEIRLGYLNLFQGNLDRLFGNYEKATVEYSKVIEAYPEATEYMPDLFFAHKGRLISREQLGYGDTFQEEIEIALEFLKKYRDRITEDENRNSFFDREQSVTNIAAGFYLKQNDPEKAFDLIESAKARSLLDIITGNGKYDSAENQIIFSGSTKSEGLREIQQKLPEDIQMLQYAVLESKIVIWLVERNASFVEIVPARSEELSTQAKQFLDQIKTRSPEANLTSQKLYEPLIAPIEAKLDAKKQLVIVPDGMLYEVPFAALKKRDGHFLIEDRAISYAPSASTFIALTQKAAQTLPGEKLLAVGNPDFDRAANSAFAPLPAARKEAEAIATLYPNSNKLLEAEAKKLAVLSELRDTDVFHFAGHYAVSPASPLNSKLLLAKPEGAGDEFSGELRAFEILNTKPAHLKLVVLSACETGLERVFQGEGAVGMARTFLAAGAPLVIASQWKVESDSTSELMTAFHRHRRENKLPSAEALRRAQLEILRRAEYAEPYFWSAFAAVGAYANY
jgi:CHAT domain-containing protein